jgi:hypothetical protein
VDSINLLVKIADQVKGSALFPRDIGENRSNMLAVMLRGRELGMQPMESLQAMYVVHGRIGMYHDSMVRHMLRERVKLEWLRDDDDGAEIKGVRPDGYAYTSRWSKDDSQKAGLLAKDKNGNDSMHTKYPRNMFRARAVANLYRMLGVGPRVYAPEELLYIPPDEFTAETIQGAAGTAEASGIDEKVIRPEDEARLREVYGIYDLGPKVATAFLLKVQADVIEKGGGNPEWAQQAVTKEIIRVKNDFHGKVEEKKAARRRKKSASEQAAEEAPEPEQKVNGKAQAAPEDNPADDEPQPEPEAPKAAQASLGDDW